MNRSQPIDVFMGEISIMKQKLFLQILIVKDRLNKVQEQYEDIKNSQDGFSEQQQKQIKERVQKQKKILLQKQVDFKAACKIELDSQIQLNKRSYSEQIANERLSTYEQIQKTILETSEALVDLEKKKEQYQKQYALKEKILIGIKENMETNTELKRLQEQNKHSEKQKQIFQKQKINMMTIKAQYKKSIEEKNEQIKNHIQEMTAENIKIEKQIISSKEEILIKKQCMKDLVKKQTQLLENIKKITEDNENKNNKKIISEVKEESYLKSSNPSHMFNNEGYSQILAQEQLNKHQKCQINISWSSEISKRRHAIGLLLVITILIFFRIK